MGRNVPARGKSPGSVRNGLDLEVFRRYWLTLRSRKWAFSSLAILIQNGSFMASMNRWSRSRSAHKCLEQLFLRLPGGYPGARRSGNASPEGSSGACVLAIGEGFSYLVKTVAHCFALPKRHLGARDAVSAPTGAAFD
jgi:hypothetical protein